MADYRITIENLRPQDKLSLIGDGTFNTKATFTIIADKIKAYNSDGTETEFVLSGESVIDTTITDGYDYEETFRCHGAIYAEGYLWLSMRTAGADTLQQTSQMPQILKVNPYDLSDYEILYYDSFYTIGGIYSSSIDQLIYANGYIWFPHSYGEKKLIRLDPNISLSNENCYIEFDYSSIGGSFLNTTLINDISDNYIYIGTSGGINDSGGIPCTNVSLNNKSISFTLQNINITYNLKSISIYGFKINGYESYGSHFVEITSITNVGNDVNIIGNILHFNDTDVFTLSASQTARIAGSIVIKIDISDVNNISVDDVFYIGTSSNLHASMQYGNSIIFTSQESQCVGQVALKILNNDSCEFGLIPSSSFSLIEFYGNYVWFGFNNVITDDICCIGDYGYFGNENEGNKSTIYKFDLINMKNYDSITIDDVDACYGTFSYNNQVYALFSRQPGKIVILTTNLDVVHEIILPNGYDTCNEFVVTDDSIYITFWDNRPLRMIRIPNLSQSGYILNPQITIDDTKNIVAFDVYDNNNAIIKFPINDIDNNLSYDTTGEYVFEISQESMIETIKAVVAEHTFEYPILKDSTQYDPLSYISYDYMISTSRRAKFDALILDYFNEESFDFVNMLTRVGYKEYDNDIKLYNHYYYSNEDNEDEFVRIELDDNTVKHEIGKSIIDKYGISRTVSSREVVTEGISTLMCRIYEKHFDGEKLVYSGLIDKRETKFNGKILSIGLIDMMGLYTELSEKFNIVVNDASSNDSGFGVINIKNKIIEFVDILRTELNINNDYFPSYDNISENIDHEIDYYGGITVFNEPEIPVPYESGYVLEYNLDIGLYQTSLSYGSQRIASGGIDNQVKGFLKISANKNDNGYINLSFDDISLYTSLNDFDFPSENNYEYLYPVNYYGKKLKRIKNYGDDLVVNNNIQYETHTYEDEDSTRATVINAIFTYTDDNNGESSVFKFIFNVGIIGTDSRLRFSGVKEYTMTLDQQQSFEYVTSGSTSETDLLIWLKNIFSIRFGQLSSFLKSFENYFNNYICSNIVEFIGYPSNEIIYSESVEDMNKVNMVLTKESFYEKLPQNEGLMPFTYSVVMTNSYFSSIPIYSGDISFYDITKLFSLICYNRIYTDDYGVLRFDADSYESNNHIIISTNDIINNYSQDAMIGNNEEFNSLNSIYVGSGGLKIAYKRLESSVNETYKTLYENNNMKISFKLKNIDYKVYDLNNVGQYVYRKIEVNDIIRININNTGNKAFNIFVTSLKYENNGYIVSIEGITVE